MKKVRKMLPVSIADISGLENWLEEQANQGFFPVRIGSWATFTPTGVPGTRFRIEPYGKSGDAPTEEQLALYRDAGWEYAFAVGSGYYFLFYTTDPSAVELYSDNESRGISLEWLEKAARLARRKRILIFFVVAALTVWTIFFHKSEFDVQPDNLAYLPLGLLRVFDPLFLIFLLAQIFVFWKDSRDFKLLKKTCKALREGLALPPSPGPSRKIVVENIVTLTAIVPLLLLILWQQLAPYRNIPLDNFRHPYVAIQEIESMPVYQGKDVFEEPPFRNASETYYAEREFSLLAPKWYSVTQEAYSPQNGTRGNVFSKDPENGANRYSPELDTTCFTLLFPSMAEPVAKAQMDQYRLINLRWSYESLDYPGLDFVILASEPNELWQMAALGKGGRVAVFRYGGQANLRDHLETLSTLVM